MTKKKTTTAKRAPKAKKLNIVAAPLEPNQAVFYLEDALAGKPCVSRMADAMVSARFDGISSHELPARVPRRRDVRRDEVDLHDVAEHLHKAKQDIYDAIMLTTRIARQSASKATAKPTKNAQMLTELVATLKLEADAASTKADSMKGDPNEIATAEGYADGYVAAIEQLETLIKEMS